MTDSYHFQIEPEPRVESAKGTFEVHTDGSVSGVSPYGDSFHYTALQIDCHSGGLEGYIIGLTYGGYTRRDSIVFPSGAAVLTSGDKIVGRVEAEAAQLFRVKVGEVIEPLRDPLDWNTATPFDTFGADFIVTKGEVPTAPLHTSPTTDSAYPAIAGLLRG